MIIPRFIRKMLAVFRGSVSPVMIFISVTLGFWFGLVPGWSGFHTLIVVVVLILNVHLGLFLLSGAIGKMLCFAGAPVLYHIGVGVQGYLSGLLRLLASIPIVAITDFDRYSVAAALVVGPVIGAIAGLFLVRSVIGFRRMLLKFEEGSDKFKKWYSKRWVRILDRLLVGRRTKDAKALFTGKTKIVRKAGVFVAALVLIVSVVIADLVKDDAIKEHATKMLTRANGAEVDVNELDLSLLTGAVSASGIQVTDAKKPENNQIAIERIGADASMYSLLLGKVVMEKVEVSDVRFNRARTAPGKVVDADKEEKSPVFDPCDFKIEAGDIAKIEGYLKNAKALKEWLGKIRKWLPKSDEAAEDVEQIPQKYLEYLDARAVVPPCPRVLAKEILLEKVQIPSAVFGSSRIHMQNVSDAPQAAGLPVTFELESNDTSAALKIVFDFGSRGEASLVSGTFGGLDLSRIQSSLGSGAGLVFEKGVASGKFNGDITSESIDLVIDLALHGLQAKGRGKGVLGLGSQTTSEALGVLKELNTTIRIVGPVTEPRLVFDTKGLTKAFKEALVKAGKEKIAEEVDKRVSEQIDKALGDKVPDEVKDALKKPTDLIKDLGGILGGKDDKADE